MELPNIVYARVDNDDDGEFVVSSDVETDMLDFNYGVYEIVDIINKNKINTTGEV